MLVNFDGYFVLAVLFFVVFHFTLHDVVIYMKVPWTTRWKNEIIFRAKTEIKAKPYISWFP